MAVLSFYTNSHSSRNYYFMSCDRWQVTGDGGPPRSVWELRSLLSSAGWLQHILRLCRKPLKLTIHFVATPQLVTKHKMLDNWWSRPAMTSLIGLWHACVGSSFSGAAVISVFLIQFRCVARVKMLTCFLIIFSIPFVFVFKLQPQMWVKQNTFTTMIYNHTRQYWLFCKHGLAHADSNQIHLVIQSQIIQSLNCVIGGWKFSIT